jgi:Kinesin motor domain
VGDVISALQTRSKHVPFRNSKLTYLLEDVLSGDSKVLMLAMVSPSASNVQETVCTLTFAERTAAVNLRNARTQSYSLDALKRSQIRCKTLESEVEELTKQLQIVGRPKENRRCSPRPKSPRPSSGRTDDVPSTPFQVKAQSIHKLLVASTSASHGVMRDRQPTASMETDAAASTSKLDL